MTGILFLGGPSGAGKSSFGQYLAKKPGWVHLEIDTWPDPDGIDQHGLRSEWDEFLRPGDPIPLHNKL